MSVHFLKCWSAEFAGAKSGQRVFEIRKDDRNPRYEAGDVVVLREYAPHPSLPKESPQPGTYVESGWLVFRIGYVERSKCLPTGWCGFTLEKAHAKDKKDAVDASMSGTASK